VQPLEPANQDALDDLFGGIVVTPSRAWANRYRRGK
jgi:hypothetical protein